jgi:hypothetical protein
MKNPDPENPGAAIHLEFFLELAIWAGLRIIITSSEIKVSIPVGE